MAMKQLAQRLQPLPLYFILGLTVCLFFLELVIAHVTHSLTLLLDAYHALCNIIVLVGTIISTKHGSGRSEKGTTPVQNSQEELKSLSSPPHKTELCSSTQPGPENSLRNTFGWARVDVLVMLIGCVFLVCLCLSVVCEALQTLVHISHHDEMHGPVPVLVLGVVAFILNLLAYALIGGYTSHHGSFLISGETVGADNTAVTHSQSELIAREQKRQGLRGLSRDCVGSVVVVVCAVVVASTESEVAKYVDPLFSILSAALVLLLSYPFMKESGCILMQTIPDHINLTSMCSQLVATFPDIVNVHELHVWKLTRGKTICTAHIIFLNPKEYSKRTGDISRFFLAQGITHVTVQPEFYKEYSKRTDDISRFFLAQGITHVTVQPEFYKDINEKELLAVNSDCLMECREDLCVERHCCASRTPSLESVHIDSHKHKGSHKAKSTKCSKPCLTSLSQSESMQKVAASCVSQLSQVNKDIPSSDAQQASVVPVRSEDVLVGKGEMNDEDQETRSEQEVKMGTTRKTSDV